jgi:hypothetical protein
VLIKRSAAACAPSRRTAVAMDRARAAKSGWRVLESARQRGKDPISGDNARTGQSSSHMTIPQTPFRVRTAPLPRFVKVRAGAYLFMPSLTALRFLAAFRGN